MLANNLSVLNLISALIRVMSLSFEIETSCGDPNIFLIILDKQVRKASLVRFMKTVASWQRSHM